MPTDGRGEEGAVPPRSPSVLVTRPPPGGGELAGLLEALGFEVHVFPALAIAPPEDPSALRAAALRAAAGGYQWVVLTSANGVRALREALDRATEEEGGAAGRRDAGAPGALGASRPVAPRAKLAVVGSATAEAARREGWDVELVPGTYTGEGLLEAFAAVPVEGARVLLAVAEGARDVVSRGLRARGAEVDVVVAYRSTPASGADVERVRALVAERRLALITLASPSAAEGLLELAGPAVLAVPAVTIGPVTAGVARTLGFDVVAVAQPHTNEGLAAAAAAWRARSV
jgi:uroporphyrinogen-III synthase